MNFREATENAKAYNGKNVLLERVSEAKKQKQHISPYSYWVSPIFMYAIQGSPSIANLAREHFLDTVSYNDRSHQHPNPQGRSKMWMGRWIWVGTSPTNIKMEVVKPLAQETDYMGLNIRVQVTPGL